VQKRGAKVAHEVIEEQIRTSLHLHDGDSTGGTCSEGDKIRQEESTHSIYTLLKKQHS
jgi:hypothetical protein